MIVTVADVTPPAVSIGVTRPIDGRRHQGRKWQVNVSASDACDADVSAQAFVALPLAADEPFELRTLRALSRTSRIIIERERN